MGAKQEMQKTSAALEESKAVNMIWIQIWEWWEQKL